MKYAERRGIRKRHRESPYALGVSSRQPSKFTQNRPPDVKPASTSRHCRNATHICGVLSGVSRSTVLFLPPDRRTPGQRPISCGGAKLCFRKTHPQRPPAQARRRKSLPGSTIRFQNSSTVTNRRPTIFTTIHAVNIREIARLTAPLLRRQAQDKTAERRVPAPDNVDTRFARSRAMSFAALLSRPSVRSKRHSSRQRVTSRSGEFVLAPEGRSAAASRTTSPGPLAPIPAPRQPARANSSTGSAHQHGRP